MKSKFFLWLLGILACCPAQSQNTNNWFSDDSRWTYRWNILNGFGYEELSIDGDTLIEDQLCVKLQPQIVYQRLPEEIPDTIFAIPHYMYESQDSVFLWSGNEFVLVYNFSLAVGDSLAWMGKSYGDEFKCPSGIFIVEKITELDLGEIKVRQQHGRIVVDRMLEDAYTYIVTERIGFTGRVHIRNAVQRLEKFGHLIPANAFNCAVDADHWQFCAFQTSGIYYNPSDENCRQDIVLSRHEFLDDSPTIFPNPISTEISLINFGPIEYIHVYDSYGRLVQTINHPDAQITLAAEITGVILLEIKTVGDILWKKLLKY